MYKQYEDHSIWWHVFAHMHAAEIVQKFSKSTLTQTLTLSKKSPKFKKIGLVRVKPCSNSAKKCMAKIWRPGLKGK